MSLKSATKWIVVTASFVVDGAIAAIGDLVKVAEHEADNLLYRGKARPATDDEVAAAAAQPETDPAPDAPAEA